MKSGLFTLILLAPFVLSSQSGTLSELNARLILFYTQNTREFARIESNGWLYEGQKFNDATFSQLDFSPYAGANGETVYRLADAMPEFPGGLEKMKVNLSFVTGEDQFDDCIDCRWHPVFVSFVVRKDGSIADAKPILASDIAYPDDQGTLAAKAAGHIRAMPRWTPARLHGEPVACEMMVLVRMPM